MELTGKTKADYRKMILEQRKALIREEVSPWDREILKRLSSLTVLQKQSTDTVYCYIGVRGETGTTELIKHFLKEDMRVAVPRVKGKTMDFYYIKDFDDLEPGGFGIPEPKAGCQRAEKTAAPVIVPGVAFSRQYERTGYGAGYYDRFFEKEPQHEKIAICYDFQLFDAIAVESFDVPMDYIVTQSELLCRKES